MILTHNLDIKPCRQLFRLRKYDQHCVKCTITCTSLSNCKSFLHMTRTTQHSAPACPSSWKLWSMIHAPTKVKSALRWAVWRRLRQKKRITIQNLLNEFKNSYFSTFAIQSLRLGLRRWGMGRRGAEKKNLHSYSERGSVREDGASR